MAAPAARAWAMPVADLDLVLGQERLGPLDHLVGEGEGLRVLRVELPLERDLDHVQQRRLATGAAEQQRGQAQGRLVCLGAGQRDQDALVGEEGARFSRGVRRSCARYPTAPIPGPEPSRRRRR